MFSYFNPVNGITKIRVIVAKELTHSRQIFDAAEPVDVVLLKQTKIEGISYSTNTGSVI